MVKEKKKKKRSPIGCSVPIVLFIIFMVFSSTYGVKMLKEGYDMAEKKLNRESFEEVHTRFVSLPAVVDLNLSEIEIRTLLVKFFLLRNCEGGEETMDKFAAYEQNILWDACLIVQNNKFFSKSFSMLENLNNLTKQKKALKGLLETDFKGAVKLYDWYINE